MPRKMVPMNLLSLTSLAAAAVLLSCSSEKPPPEPPPIPTTSTTISITTTPTSPRKGLVQATDSAPATFPHRIWAAADFESGQLPDYAWFGQPQTTNIPSYLGNATALASQPSQYAAREVGMNPVPGPRMGHVNHFHCRYHLTGATEAIFQYYSLTRRQQPHPRHQPRPEPLVPDHPQLYPRRTPQRRQQAALRERRTNGRPQDPPRKTRRHSPPR